MAGHYESEDCQLISGSMKRDRQAKPDWSRFGLSAEQQREAELSQRTDAGEDEEVFEHHGDSEKNELFTEDQSSKSKPWWKANFFISEPVLFGTWDGVFTSCMINIFGVVIFLRTGWMVGNAGIGLSVLIIFMTVCVALIAVLSSIGVCERCHMESGGVYFLLSHVLGARFGATIGILYCFGQAVACSLYTVGFGESIAALFNQENVWVARGIASGVLILLLGINVAGVKWVIRLQLVLLMVLFIAVLDFLVGSFVHTDTDNGFVGYHSSVLANNTGPSYLPGESFFTVFGVFFPTATGVFAGINMSGDLKNPRVNIPVGTLASVGVTTLLYLIFAMVLGATCLRGDLQTDYMIAEKVSIVGVLFLAGLYISSISSCMGGLYGSPRIIQCIANENVIPIIKVLGQGRGPNKVPVFALIVVTLIALLFIFIGNVNTLGPIVTMPFMLSYAAVDYAYFSLAMSFDKRHSREARLQKGTYHSVANGYPDKLSPNGALGTGGGAVTSPAAQNQNYGAIQKKSSDLDNLFPERNQHKAHEQRRDSLGSPDSPTFYADGGAPKEFPALTQPGVKSDATSMTSEVEDTTGLLVAPANNEDAKPKDTEITSQPRSFYSIFCNRWLSLLGVLICIVIMFAIQWGYALANISVGVLIYIYIGQANPGVFPGIAEFSMYEWVRDGIKNCCRRGPPPPEQIVVTPNTPAMQTMASQLTEDNEDFAERGRYHQSEVVRGENFDDYDSE